MAGGNSHQRKMAKKAMERLEKKVTNAVVERLSGSSQEVPETAPAKQRGLPQLVKYLRGIGIIGLLLGGSGIVFTKPILFWWAAGFLWLGLLAWAVDVWFEPNIGRWLRWGGMALILILCSAFTFGIAFYPAPLNVITTSYEGLYKPGESIYGIKWDADMSDLRIDINNPTNRDYDHLDVTITLPVKDHLYIRDRRQITDVPNVNLMQTGKKIHLKLTDKNGNVLKEHENRTVGDSGFRLLCDRLPKHTTIGLIIAVSELAPEVAKFFTPDNITVVSYDPKTDKIWIRSRPTSVLVNGEYSVINRPYRYEHTQRIKQE